MQNTIKWLQARYKAIVGTILGFLGPLVILLQTNQHVTERDVLVAILAGIVTGGAVHQVSNIGGE